MSRIVVLFRFSLLVASASVFVGCASHPPDTPAVPSWVRQSARTPAGTALVFVESYDDPDAGRARENAEGLALADVANECSLLPKGIRVEEQYSAKTGHLVQIHVRVRIENAVCESSKKTQTPEAVRAVADAEATARLKLFQDRTGEPKLDESGSVDEAQALAVARQKLALVKQQILLGSKATGEGKAQAGRLLGLTRDVVKLEGALADAKQTSLAWSHYRHELMRPRFGADGNPVAMPVHAPSGKSSDNE